MSTSQPSDPPREASAATVVVLDGADDGAARRVAAAVVAGLAVLAAVIVIVLLLRPTDGAAGPSTAAPPPPEPDRPVSIALLPDVVAPGDIMTAMLVAHEVNDLVFGIAVDVERWDGEQWRPAGVAALCLAEWSCVGTVTDRLEAVEGIGLTALSPEIPGSTTLLSTEGLGEGWYRIVQPAALDEGTATGIFQVRRDAPAAPPQPGSDEVRLGVVPALVPPDGGLVRVVTEVPAGSDGVLTAEDVESVDDALDPTALVQRWDGAQWLDVTEVPVQDREADRGVEWGAPALLPELDEGSYRLLRTRDGEPVWGVFTVRSDAPTLSAR